MLIEDICEEIISSVAVEHTTQVTKHCTFDHEQFRAFQSQGGVARIEEILDVHYPGRVRAWDKPYGGGKRQLMVEISPRAPK